MPSYEASVPLGWRGSRTRRTIKNLQEAKAWRARGVVAAADGLLRVTAVTLNESAEDLVAGMERGSVRTRSGDLYKPSVIRGYATSLRLRLLPTLGARKLSDISRREVQRLVDGWLEESIDASTIRNWLMPMRVIYRRAVEDGLVALSPCDQLRLPRVDSRRARIASVSEARTLLAALPLRDRALYAMAFYAGLRLGELRALRWSDVDLTARRIQVERALDGKGSTVAPKRRAGLRTVPMLSVELRRVLADHRDASRALLDNFVFSGVNPTSPFTPSNVHRRVRVAWCRATLDPIPRSASHVREHRNRRWPQRQGHRHLESALAPTVVRRRWRNDALPPTTLAWITASECALHHSTMSAQR